VTRNLDLADYLLIAKAVLRLTAEAIPREPSLGWRVVDFLSTL
jgi:hypothetical protein